MIEHQTRPVPDLAGSDDPSASLSSQRAAIDFVRECADDGLLRYIDSAFASLVHELDPDASACVLIASAIVAQMEGRGHSCLSLKDMVIDPPSLLGCADTERAALLAYWSCLPPSLEGWESALAECAAVRLIGRDPDHGQPLVLVGAKTEKPLLYLRRYWDYERLVAQHIRTRSGAQDLSADKPKVRELLDLFFPARPDNAECDWQKVACALALRGRFSVITGGPGTGKTFAAARLLALLFATAENPDQLRVSLAAPTGKAAARLKQAIDQSLSDLKLHVGSALDLDALVQRVGPARTLHSLLGAKLATRRFGRHAGKPLEVDVLIVDEASMVHLEMMSALLDALSPQTRLILLGDKDQLASVEAGAVLGDLCRNAHLGGYSVATASWISQWIGETVPQNLVVVGEGEPLAQQTVMLRQSRRFGGPIGKLAAAVNSGDGVATLSILSEGQANDKEDAEIALHEDGSVQRFEALALRGRGRHGGYASFGKALEQRTSVSPAGSTTAHAAWVTEVLRAFDQFRFLCAVREGDWGVAGVNRAVEVALERAGSIRRTGEWYAGRPVMVTRNDSSNGVFNGDVGVALPSAQGNGLRVYFLQGDQLHSVSVSRLPNVETAFAMTVHKSQGSEFAHTAVVLASSGEAALSRELVYTGITRARTALTLVSERPGLLLDAIGRPTRRSSGLSHFLSAQEAQ